MLGYTISQLGHTFVEIASSRLLWASWFVALGGVARYHPAKITVPVRILFRPHTPQDTYRAPIVDTALAADHHSHGFFGGQVLVEIIW